MPAPSDVNIKVPILVQTGDGTSLFSGSVDGLTTIPPRFTVAGVLYSVSDVSYDVTNAKYIVTVTEM